MSNRSAPRQELQVSARLRDWQRGGLDDEDVTAEVLDSVTACVNQLDQAYPNGGEHGLVFIRSCSGELSLVLLSCKHPSVPAVFIDCPVDSQRKARIHAALRRPTHQLVLVPVGIGMQHRLIPMVEENGDADLFVYDEGHGWSHEPDTRGYLISNTENLAA